MIENWIKFMGSCILDRWVPENGGLELSLDKGTAEHAIVSIGELLLHLRKHFCGHRYLEEFPDTNNQVIYRLTVHFPEQEFSGINS